MKPQHNHLADSYALYAIIRGLHCAIEMDISRNLKTEVSFPGFKLLWLLYFNSKMSVKELTYLAQTNISNVFRQLVKLEKQGFVRMESSGDLRTKHAFLTEEGQRVVQEFIEENNEKSPLQLVALIKKLPMDDYEKFMEVAAYLCNELVGEAFHNFVDSSAEKITN